MDCRLPEVPEGYGSSWAQYTLTLGDERERDALQERLKSGGIPSMVYYKRAMHQQKVFADVRQYVDLSVSERLCCQVLSLPMHPYLTEEEQELVAKHALKG